MDTAGVVNDINTWLVDEDNHSMEDDLLDLNQLVGEADDNDDGHEIVDNTEEDIIKDERDSDEEGEPNQQQKCNYFRKQLTCK